MTKDPKKEEWNFVNFGQNAGTHHSYSKRTEQRMPYRDRTLERMLLTGIKQHKDQKISVLIKIKPSVNGFTVRKKQSLWSAPVIDIFRVCTVTSGYFYRRIFEKVSLREASLYGIKTLHPSQSADIILPAVRRMVHFWVQSTKCPPL